MNRKNYKQISVCLLLMFCFSGFSQSKVYTYIQENNKGKIKSSFYIQKVVDARPNKTSIGNIYSSDLRKKYPADFEGTLSEEFQSFFKSVFAASKQKHRLLMEVKSFDIDHEHSDVFKDIGKARLNVSYYLNRNDTCIFLYNYNDSVMDETNEAQRTHPNRIRRLLLLSARKLSDSLFTTEFLSTREKTTLNRILENSTSKDAGRLRREDSVNIPPDYYMFGAGTYYNFYPEVFMFGINVHLVLRLGKTSSYLLGPSAGLLFYSTPPYNIQVPSFSSEIFNYDVGLRLLKQVKNKFFLNLNPQLMLGRVQSPSSSPEQQLRGVQVDLGAYLIPPSGEGVYSGLNLFYRSTNTTYFGEGLGLKIDLGYRF